MKGHQSLFIIDYYEQCRPRALRVSKHYIHLIISLLDSGCFMNLYSYIYWLISEIKELKFLNADKYDVTIPVMT